MVFVRRDNGHDTEVIVSEHNSSPGTYKAKLMAGQFYWAYLRLISRDCQAETWEIFIPDNSAGKWKHDFYLSAPDSTEYGGCLAGWHYKQL
ncbi:hypothetical protein HMJ29_05170 [Hymenobacter taeanensis]|uniref:Uncharacterized protein n=1 Tax=Hymenobacter taeanensis TaxID=2735321 RepID=A0A6M6BET0_9BACT|nr:MULTISPECIES: hypothetical protein [Hymenobacter]QJX46358.1 hypothetical protein HMJ29_05170 [Hymenobacter taeanensis]UOQ80219.1 hypothetical protein MUN83_15480 [Hymenobacter sp. 5414T-23]